MIRASFWFAVLFVSYLLLGKERTLRICKDIEDGYVDEIDRMRSKQMRLIFHNCDLEAENYNAMKELNLDTLDVDIASLSVEVKK